MSAGPRLVIDPKSAANPPVKYDGREFVPFGISTINQNERSPRRLVHSLQSPAAQSHSYSVGLYSLQSPAAQNHSCSVVYDDNWAPASPVPIREGPIIVNSPPRQFVPSFDAPPATKTMRGTRLAQASKLRPGSQSGTVGPSSSSSANLNAALSRPGTVGAALNQAMSGGRGNVAGIGTTATSMMVGTAGVSGPLHATAGARSRSNSLRRSRSPVFNGVTGTGTGTIDRRGDRRADKRSASPTFDVVKTQPNDQPGMKIHPHQIAEAFRPSTSNLVHPESGILHERLVERTHTALTMVAAQQELAVQHPTGSTRVDGTGRPGSSDGTMNSYGNKPGTANSYGNKTGPAASKPTSRMSTRPSVSAAGGSRRSKKPGMMLFNAAILDSAGIEKGGDGASAAAAALAISPIDANNPLFTREMIKGLESSEKPGTIPPPEFGVTGVAERPGTRGGVAGSLSGPGGMTANGRPRRRSPSPVPGDHLPHQNSLDRNKPGTAASASGATEGGIPVSGNLRASRDSIHRAGTAPHPAMGGNVNSGHTNHPPLQSSQGNAGPSTMRSKLLDSWKLENVPDRLLQKPVRGFTNRVFASMAGIGVGIGAGPLTSLSTSMNTGSVGGNGNGNSNSNAKEEKVETMKEKDMKAGRIGPSGNLMSKKKKKKNPLSVVYSGEWGSTEFENANANTLYPHFDPESLGQIDEKQRRLHEIAYKSASNSFEEGRSASGTDEAQSSSASTAEQEDSSSCASSAGSNLQTAAQANWKPDSTEKSPGKGGSNDPLTNPNTRPGQQEPGSSKKSTRASSSSSLDTNRRGSKGSSSSSADGRPNSPIDGQFGDAMSGITGPGDIVHYSKMNTIHQSVLGATADVSEDLFYDPKVVQNPYSRASSRGTVPGMNSQPLTQMNRTGRLMMTDLLSRDLDGQPVPTVEGTAGGNGGTTGAGASADRSASPVPIAQTAAERAASPARGVAGVLGGVRSGSPVRAGLAAAGVGGASPTGLATSPPAGATAYVNFDGSPNLLGVLTSTQVKPPSPGKLVYGRNFNEKGTANAVSGPIDLPAAMQEEMEARRRGLNSAGNNGSVGGMGSGGGMGSAGGRRRSRSPRKGETPRAGDCIIITGDPNAKFGGEIPDYVKDAADSIYGGGLTSRGVDKVVISPKRAKSRENTSSHTGSLEAAFEYFDASSASMELASAQALGIQGDIMGFGQAQAGALGLLGGPLGGGPSKESTDLSGVLDSIKPHLSKVTESDGVTGSNSKAVSAGSKVFRSKIEGNGENPGGGKGKNSEQNKGEVSKHQASFIGEASYETPSEEASPSDGSDNEEGAVGDAGEKKEKRKKGEKKGKDGRPLIPSSLDAFLTSKQPNEELKKQLDTVAEREQQRGSDNTENNNTNNKISPNGNEGSNTINVKGKDNSENIALNIKLGSQPVASASIIATSDGGDGSLMPKGSPGRGTVPKIPPGAIEVSTNLNITGVGTGPSLASKLVVYSSHLESKAQQTPEDSMEAYNNDYGGFGKPPGSAGASGGDKAGFQRPLLPTRNDMVSSSVLLGGIDSGSGLPGSRGGGRKPGSRGSNRSGAGGNGSKPGSRGAGVGTVMETQSLRAPVRGRSASPEGVEFNSVHAGVPGAGQTGSKPGTAESGVGGTAGASSSVPINVDLSKWKRQTSPDPLEQYVRHRSESPPGIEHQRYHNFNNTDRPRRQRSASPDIGTGMSPPAPLSRGQMMRKPKSSGGSYYSAHFGPAFMSLRHQIISSRENSRQSHFNGSAKEYIAGGKQRITVGEKRTELLQQALAQNARKDALDHNFGGENGCFVRVSTPPFPGSGLGALGGTGRVRTSSPQSGGEFPVEFGVSGVAPGSGTQHAQPARRLAPIDGQHDNSPKGGAQIVGVFNPKPPGSAEAQFEVAGRASTPAAEWGFKQLNYDAKFGNYEFGQNETIAGLSPRSAAVQAQQIQERLRRRKGEHNEKMLAQAAGGAGGNANGSKMLGAIGEQGGETGDEGQGGQGGKEGKDAEAGGATGVGLTLPPVVSVNRAGDGERGDKLSPGRDAQNGELIDHFPVPEPSIGMGSVGMGSVDFGEGVGDHHQMSQQRSKEHQGSIDHVHHSQSQHHHSQSQHHHSRSKGDSRIFGTDDEVYNSAYGMLRPSKDNLGPLNESEYHDRSPSPLGRPPPPGFAHPLNPAMPHKGSVNPENLRNQRKRVRRNGTLLVRERSPGWESGEDEEIPFFERQQRMKQSGYAFTAVNKPGTAGSLISAASTAGTYTTTHTLGSRPGTSSASAGSTYGGYNSGYGTAEEYGNYGHGAGNYGNGAGPGGHPGGANPDAPGDPYPFNKDANTHQFKGFSNKKPTTPFGKSFLKMRKSTVKTMDFKLMNCLEQEKV